jgi:hypothetical protein
MTDEERRQEAVEEAIEDLDAPGDAQRDVAGGALACRPAPSCGSPSAICGDQSPNSCTATGVHCRYNSNLIVVFEQ